MKYIKFKFKFKIVDFFKLRILSLQSCERVGRELQQISSKNAIEIRRKCYSAFLYKGGFH